MLGSRETGLSYGMFRPIARVVAFGIRLSKPCQLGLFEGAYRLRMMDNGVVPVDSSD